VIWQVGLLAFCGVIFSQLPALFYPDMISILLGANYFLLIFGCEIMLLSAVGIVYTIKCFRNFGQGLKDHCIAVLT